MQPTRRSPFARAAMVAAVAAIVQLASATPAYALTVASQRNFMEFNYCGVSARCGNNGATDYTIVNQIELFQPSVLLLVEICKSQARRFGHGE